MIVLFGFEVVYALAVTILTGVCAGMHYIGSNYDFPYFGNSAKFMSVTNLLLLAVFGFVSLWLRFDDFFALWTFFFALANVKILKHYIK